MSVDTPETVQVLDQATRARHQLRRALKFYHLSGYAPIGIDKRFWVRFAKDRSARS